jgi:hypothetical protein
MVRKQNPEHDRLNDFFKRSGLEEGRRKKNPIITAAELPRDEETETFAAKVEAARRAYASARLSTTAASDPLGATATGGPGGPASPAAYSPPGARPWQPDAAASAKQVSDDPAIASLILGTPPPKDYATYGNIYVPQVLLADQDLEHAQAMNVLRADDQVRVCECDCNTCASTCAFSARFHGVCVCVCVCACACVCAPTMQPPSITLLLFLFLAIYLQLVT